MRSRKFLTEFRLGGLYITIANYAVEEGFLTQRSQRKKFNDKMETDKHRSFIDSKKIFKLL